MPPTCEWVLLPVGDIYKYRNTGMAEWPPTFFVTPQSLVLGIQVIVHYGGKICTGVNSVTGIEFMGCS